MWWSGRGPIGAGFGFGSGLAGCCSAARLGSASALRLGAAGRARLPGCRALRMVGSWLRSRGGWPGRRRHAVRRQARAPRGRAQALLLLLLLHAAWLALASRPDTTEHTASEGDSSGTCGSSLSPVGCIRLSSFKNGCQWMWPRNPASQEFRTEREISKSHSIEMDGREREDSPAQLSASPSLVLARSCDFASPWRSLRSDPRIHADDTASAFYCALTEAK